MQKITLVPANVAAQSRQRDTVRTRSQRSSCYSTMETDHV
jgi:hypothetical protein